MIIRNGLVWSDDFTFHEKDLYIDDATHTIVDKAVSEYEEILDAKGNYVIPGPVSYTHLFLHHPIPLSFLSYFTVFKIHPCNAAL